MQFRNKVSASILATASIALAGAAAAASASSSNISLASRAVTQAHSRPGIEEQRQIAQDQAQTTLDQDAVAAIKETQNAVRLISENRSPDAKEALERATVKLDRLRARRPADSLIPVTAVVEVLDMAPVDLASIDAIAAAADRKIAEKDYPAARVLLGGLISEMRLRTEHLPLGTYPAAIKLAALLLEQKRPAEANGALMAALNTIVVIERVTPLPMVAAGGALEAAKSKGSDKIAAQKSLALARNELDRSEHLGYAGKDPDYETLDASILDLDTKLNGTEETGADFAALIKKFAAFFSRQSHDEKKSGAPTTAAVTAENR
jgi:hypothetical protein